MNEETTPDDTSGETGDTSGDTSGETGDTSGETGDTSGDTSGETGDTPGEISVDIDTYYDAVEVLINHQNGTQSAVLLRSFAVEESDLTTQAHLLRRVIGKSLIAMPDGTNNFICHLSDVASITVRRNVTVSYRYTL